MPPFEHCRLAYPELVRERREREGEIDKREKGRERRERRGEISKNTKLEVMYT